MIIKRIKARLLRLLVYLLSIVLLFTSGFIAGGIFIKYSLHEEFPVLYQLGRQIRWFVYSPESEDRTATDVPKDTKIPDDPKFTTIMEDFHEEFDISDLIMISNAKDAQNKRNALITSLWTDGKLPARVPEEVDSDYTDLRYHDLENLERIERITVIMDFGINSIAYLFVPTKHNGKLLIYHQGHSGDFIKGKKTIAFFLEKGFSVLALSMPLLGMNNTPLVHIKRLGPFVLNEHRDLALLETENINPIKLFMEPVAVCLNYALDKFDYTDVIMVGISGGGWTTTVYAAIDPRIRKSFPVAGSLPLFLRTHSYGWNDWGDYEQSFVGLLGVCNYLEMYVLGAWGKNRMQEQILNLYDPCCFGGVRYKVYEDIVKNVVTGLEHGSFTVFVDTSHTEHDISDAALEEINNKIESCEK